MTFLFLIFCDFSRDSEETCVFFLSSSSMYASIQTARMAANLTVGRCDRSKVHLFRRKMTFLFLIFSDFSRDSEETCVFFLSSSFKYASIQTGRMAVAPHRRPLQ
jgi:hypothetical protein